MRLHDKRKRQALKELASKRRLTMADLAAAASRGERRLRAEEMSRLGRDLADQFVRQGFARRVVQTSIIEWVPSMT
jgi:hypothetical protein